MKTQTQFYNQENATEYWEQYFTTQTPIQISLEQYNEIKNMLDDLTQLLSEGNNVNVQFTIVEE